MYFCVQTWLRNLLFPSSINHRLSIYSRKDNKEMTVCNLVIFEQVNLEQQRHRVGS